MTTVCSEHHHGVPYTSYEEWKVRIRERDGSEFSKLEYVRHVSQQYTLFRYLSIMIDCEWLDKDGGTYSPSGENCISLTGFWKLKWWSTTPRFAFTKSARPSKIKWLRPKGSYQEKKGLTFIYRNKYIAIWAKGYRGDIFAVFKGEGEGLVTIPKKSSKTFREIERWKLLEWKHTLQGQTLTLDCQLGCRASYHRE